MRGLRAGSIIADVVLKKGCVADGRNLADVLEDLQHQLCMPESRLMNGGITRHTIFLIEDPSRLYTRDVQREGEREGGRGGSGAADAPLCVKSSVGGDLTAWGPGGHSQKSTSDQTYYVNWQ